MSKPQLTNLANELIHWREEQSEAARAFQRSHTQMILSEVALVKAMDEGKVDSFALDDGREVVRVKDTQSIEIIDKE